MRRLTIILGVLLALAAVAAVARAGNAPAAAGDLEGGITVTGTASIAAVPTQASLWIGVESQGETARAALAANAAQMRRVIAALRSAGATDLQTQHVNVSPRYVGDGAVQGYTAQNSVSATIEQLGRTGAVVDAAVAAGANQIAGPTLSHADPDALYRQALVAAVADARVKAQALASAAGVALGRVTAVVEGGAAPAPMPLAAARAADEATTTPIEPGQGEITANVSVTFSIT